MKAATKYDVGFWACVVLSTVCMKSPDSAIDLFFGVGWLALGLVHAWLIFTDRS